jgi:hypothetical protein
MRLRLLAETQSHITTLVDTNTARWQHPHLALRCNEVAKLEECNNEQAGAAVQTRKVRILPLIDTRMRYRAVAHRHILIIQYRNNSFIMWYVTCLQANTMPLIAFDTRLVAQASRQTSWSIRTGRVKSVLRAPHVRRLRNWTAMRCNTLAGLDHCYRAHIS